MTGLLIGASGLAVITAPAAGQAPGPPARRAVPAAGGVARPKAVAVGSRSGEAFSILDPVVPQAPPLPDKTIAGLPEQTPAEYLTWDRVYALALVHARSIGRKAAEALDPRILAEQAQWYGVADFARFRSMFLTGRAAAGSVYRDPGAAYLALLGRIQAVERCATECLAVRKPGEARAGDRPGAWCGFEPVRRQPVRRCAARARRRLAQEVAGFRDALDELKPALGLSPHAAVVPDRRDLAGFRDVFEAIEAWQKNPGRDLVDLPRTIERLPDPGEAVVGGRPILRAIEQDPARLEEVLRDAALRAIAIRSASDRPRAPGDGNLAIELRVRRRIRGLLEMRGEYAEQKQQYALGVRMADEVFQLFISTTTPVAGSSRSLMLHDVIDNMRHVWETRDRLVALWTSFRAERLALYRDLGELPYDNWDAFYADHSAPGRARAPEAPAAAPAGPAPAAPAPPTPSTASPARP